MVLGIGVGSYNAAFMHLITHAIFKACLFLAAGSVIHSLHDPHTHAGVQEMPRMGGLKNKLKFTWIAMWCCTLAISGIPFFSGFVSKDRILGDALLMALSNKWYIAPTILGFFAALLTAFYMCRMMFLTFHGQPRDKEVYDHCHEEHLTWNSNVPLLILSVFTLGIWFSGSLTGQGLVKVAGDRYEWFQTLIHEPVPAKFATHRRQQWGSEDIKSGANFPRASYDSNHGLSEEEAHHVHHIHHIGAIMSIIIAFSGVFLAFLMYVKKSVDPGWWVSTFSGWYKSLKNKYYFDDLYIGVLIQKGLLPFNNLLAAFDMGVYDRYAVDGWATVNRVMYKFARWFDDLIVDTVAVDGTGASVRLFNLVLRTVQSGKIQFYFLIIVFVLAGYAWKLVIN